MHPTWPANYGYGAAQYVPAQPMTQEQVQQAGNQYYQALLASQPANLAQYHTARAFPTWQPPQAYVPANVPSSSTQLAAGRTNRPRWAGAPQQQARAGNTSAAAPTQRQSNVDVSLWATNHLGRIQLGSGTTRPVGGFQIREGETDIHVSITERDLNHFLTGHTVRDFSFEPTNIERSMQSTFWPAGTRSSEVLSAANGVLRELSAEIKEAVGIGETLSRRGFQYGDIQYSLLVTVEPNDEGPMTEEGEFLQGRARLEQFYPTSGNGILTLSQDDLYAVKERLGK